MRTLALIALATISSAAFAGEVKVTAKALKPAEVSHLQAQIDAQEKDIMRDNDKHFDPAQPGSTPALDLATRGGSKISLVRKVDYNNQYNVNGAQVHKVVSTDANDTLSITALIPVSGHVGSGPARTPGQKIGKWDILSNKNEQAAAWAASNTYNVTVTHLESGDTTRLGGIKSTGLVTAHELNIEMPKKGTYRVQAWADGSSTGGYVAGRTIDLIKE